ncbi:hypothetical protein FOA52_015091 [Chlamydomonas sp. UWO 241]|nr:hypothetical protein FOA52_015091 [Chlamydomonas sp. UWO 241]
MVSAKAKGGKNEGQTTPKDASYATAYDQIRAQRLAKFGSKEDRAKREAAAAAEKEEEIEAFDNNQQVLSPDLVAQKGDRVYVAWECAIAATGKVVDSRADAGGLPGRSYTTADFQLGTAPGFEPKQGLKLAFSLVTDGLQVGDETQVVCRPSGSFLFKAYQVLDMNGRVLSQLTHDETRLSWANEEAVLTLKVLKIQPPRGRARN